MKRNIIVLEEKNKEYAQAKVEAEQKINALTANIKKLEVDNLLLQENIAELSEKTKVLSKQLDNKSKGIVKLNKKNQKLESELEERKIKIDKLNEKFSTEINNLKNQLCLQQNKTLTHESSDKFLKLGEVQNKIHDYLATLTVLSSFEGKRFKARMTMEEPSEYYYKKYIL